MLPLSHHHFCFRFVSTLAFPIRALTLPQPSAKNPAWPGTPGRTPRSPAPLRESWRRLARLGIRSPSNSHAGPRPIRPGARASLPGGKRSGVMETAEPPPWGCFPVSFCYCRWDAAIERLSGVFLSCDGLWDRVNTGVNSLLLCSHCPVGLSKTGPTQGTVCAM